MHQGFELYRRVVFDIHGDAVGLMRKVFQIDGIGNKVGTVLLNMMPSRLVWGFALVDREKSKRRQEDQS
jgi:hypothetical protein